MTMSASLTTDGMSFVRLWHTVTVALFAMSSMATGLPMTRLLPMTTARLPDISTLLYFRISMQLSAVQGAKPAPFPE